MTHVCLQVLALFLQDVLTIAKAGTEVLMPSFCLLLLCLGVRVRVRVR